MLGRTLKATLFSLVLVLGLGHSHVAQADPTIAVTNNVVGTLDTVVVSDVTNGDIVRVYSVPTGGTPIGCTVVSTDTPATIYINQLGVAAGNVYVTTQSPTDPQQSARTPASYLAESAYVAIALDKITVVNNYVGTPDSIVVSGLTAGDIVRAYSVSKGGSPIASAIVPVGGTVTMYVDQLGVTASKIYVTGTSNGKTESLRTTKPYLAEAVTDKLTANQVTVTNNKQGVSDTVVVTGLGVYSDGCEVKVYSSTTTRAALGMATVASGATTVTVTIPQLGITRGNVYVTVKILGRNESPRLAKAYDSEISVAPVASKITIANNNGSDDTVKVTGLVAGDTVKVYDLNGVLIGTEATVAPGATTATFTIPQLGRTSGSVYVTVTKFNKLESAKTAKAYAAEVGGTGPATTTITVSNNYEAVDTITVTGLMPNDVVKVYSVATGGTAIGSATVASNSASITIPQLGTTAGYVYISVTPLNGAESVRTRIAYLAEPVTATLKANQVIVTNNQGIPDTVVVTGLTVGDVVKVYSSTSARTELGTGTMGTSTTSVAITIPQLGITSGNVYVTAKTPGKNESARLAKAYDSEISLAPLASKITITNNRGSADTVKVTGLVAGDTVKVYHPNGNLLGTSIIVASPDTFATVPLQLESTSGSVYVTVTKANKLESARTAKAYLAEPA